MNSRNRVVAALNNQQPDRVPIFELQIDEPIVVKLAALLGFLKTPSGEVGTFVHGEESKEIIDLYCNIHKTLGLDATCTLFSPGMKNISEVLVRDKYDCVFKLSEYGEPIIIDGPIKSSADLKSYDMASRLQISDFENLRVIIDKLGNDVAHFLAINDPFKVSWMLRGDMANLLMDFMLHPDLVHDVARVATDFLLAEVEIGAKLGVDGIVIEGDLSGETNTFMSPDHFRKFIKPYEQELVNRIHQLGLKAIKHGDGNMWPLLNDLIEVGFDGFNPVQPQCMEIGEVKAHLTGKMCIIGNIDCRYLLPFGMEEEVEETVRQTISIAAPGGGYIISSSNSIHAGCKPENYIAMVRAAHKYGSYN